MRRATFRVVGKLDGARAAAGTVTIDRDSLVFAVRPLRRRREYALPLGVVAEIVCAKVIKAEVAQRKAAGRKARKGGGRG